MNPIIKRIQDDHKHIGRILSCLNHEIDAFCHNEDGPYLSIIMDALEYMSAYPENIHHPLEDLVYAEMKSSIDDIDLLRLLEVIKDQHVELKTLNQRLSSDFNGVANGQVMPMDALLRDYRNFLDLQVEHLECENRYLIPAMEDFLTEEISQRIAASLSDEQSQLMNEKLLQEYDDLYHYVLKHENTSSAKPYAESRHVAPR